MFFLITYPLKLQVTRDVPFSFSQIMMSSLLLGMSLSDFSFWFHNMVPLPS